MSNVIVSLLQRHTIQNSETYLLEVVTTASEAPYCFRKRRHWLLNPLQQTNGVSIMIRSDVSNFSIAFLKRHIVNIGETYLWKVLTTASETLNSQRRRWRRRLYPQQWTSISEIIIKITTSNAISVTSSNTWYKQSRRTFLKVATTASEALYSFRRRQRCT